MTRSRLGVGVALALAALAAPAPAAAHGLVGRLDSALPLFVYVAGAGIAVALSFAIGFAYQGRWRPGTATPIRRVPAPLLILLRILGLFGWAWIVAQFIVGGSSTAEVGTLFTSVYGWVGIAILSALLAPVWTWLDPFTTLHDIGAWILRRLGFRGWRPAPWPERLASWPAVIGFVLLVWLELAFRGGDMGLIVVVYTVYTLTFMAHFGRQQWLERGDVFGVWFGLLNRLARYTSAGPRDAALIRRQHFPDGLLGRPWDASLVTLVAVATGAILYDGLSQTQAFFELFGLPGSGQATLLLGAFLAAVAGLSLLVGRRVGLVAMGAGLLPISVGYLIAHYLTYLLGDGQRIVIAISDPLQLGWDLAGTAFYEPSMAWLPTSLVWTVMFAAVVGGHVLGAWAGHLHVDAGPTAGHGRRAQLPLAVVMVGLTALTLWSLGQNVFRPEPTPAPAASIERSGARS